eukprot:5936291-Prymnesium_polylepis.1
MEELLVVAELALNMLVMRRIAAAGPRVVTVRCLVEAEEKMGQVEELGWEEEVVAVGWRWCWPWWRGSGS